MVGSWLVLSRHYKAKGPLRFGGWPPFFCGASTLDFLAMRVKNIYDRVHKPVDLRGEKSWLLAVIDHEIKTQVLRGLFKKIEDDFRQQVWRRLPDDRMIIDAAVARLKRH